MSRYMRDKFSFYGIPSPLRLELLRDTIHEIGAPSSDELTPLIKQLSLAPERENQYAAIDILKRSKSKLAPDMMPLAEAFITHKSWWDSVDMLSQHLVGQLWFVHPELKQKWLPQWRSSDDLWLRRTTLIFQLKYKRDTDFTLLSELIELNRNSDEFFIQKAIGWALREYSKTDADRVIDFVIKTPLKPLSEREALKWLAKHRITQHLVWKLG